MYLTVGGDTDIKKYTKQLCISHFYLLYHILKQSYICYISTLIFHCYDYLQLFPCFPLIPTH